MLGLGNTVLQSSISGDELLLDLGLPLSSSFQGFDWPDTDSVRVYLNYATSAGIEGVLSGDSAAVYSQLTGATFTMTVKRYDDLISNGGTVQASASATVYAYKLSSNGSIVAVHFSEANVSSISPSGNGGANIGQGGTQNLDLSSFGSSNTDVTPSGTGVSALYVFELLVQAPGYINGTESTTELTMVTPS